MKYDVMRESKKGVRFSTSPVREYTSATSAFDKKSTWYSTSDYACFRKARDEDATAIRGRNPNDLAEDECFWGIESSIVPNLRDRALLTRRRACIGVLAEQKAQRIIYKSDPEDISKASSTHTEWSASVARKKALFYAKSLHGTEQVRQHGCSSASRHASL
jgi:hypothetical protein